MGEVVIVVVETKIVAQLASHHTLLDKCFGAVRAARMLLRVSMNDDRRALTAQLSKVGVRTEIRRTVFDVRVVPFRCEAASVRARVVSRLGGAR